jgi:cation:H+ antiporter
MLCFTQLIKEYLGMLVYMTALFVIGLVLLAFSSDRFVVQVSSIAEIMRVPPMWVGIVLMGFATTFPEFLVSLISAYHGHGGLALGNILGSYITNLDLVLGLCILIAPMKIGMHVLRVDLPIMLFSVLISSYLLSDGYFGVRDGLILLGFFSVYIIYLMISVWYQPKGSSRAIKAALPKSEHRSTMRVVSMLVLSFLGMSLGSELMVDAASEIAHHFGVDDLLIGLTVVAIGTSLPELAASLASVRREKYALAMGNVLGSNIMTMLGVITVPALMLPQKRSFHEIQGYLLLMVVSTLIVTIAIVLGHRREMIALPRWMGWLLLLCFLAYLFLTGVQAGLLNALY